MSGLTKLGILFFIAGIVILGYQGVSTLMGQTGAADNFIWKNMSLADALGGNTDLLGQAILAKPHWF